MKLKIFKKIKDILNKKDFRTREYKTIFIDINLIKNRMSQCCFIDQLQDRFIQHGSIRSIVVRNVFSLEDLNEAYSPSYKCYMDVVAFFDPHMIPAASLADKPITKIYLDLNESECILKHYQDILGQDKIECRLILDDHFRLFITEVFKTLYI